MHDTSARTNSRTLYPRAWATLTSAMLALAAIGCASSNPLGPVPSAVGPYERGQYEIAYRNATAEHARSEGDRRDRAALLAGLSAHALGRPDEATIWLTPLLRNNDDDVAGRAAATLGLIALEQARHDRAAGLLAIAGRLLVGDAAARANYFAGEAYDDLGRTDSARVHYRLAGVTATDPALRSAIDARLGVAGYAVQLGAFRDENNARRLAAGARATAALHGLAAPRVIPRRDGLGPTLYLVQVGSFQSERDANEARVLLGRGAVVSRAQPGG